MVSDTPSSRMGAPDGTTLLSRLGSSRKAGSTLNHWDISPVHSCWCFLRILDFVWDYLFVCFWLFIKYFRFLMACGHQGYMLMNEGTLGGQKRKLNSLKLKLWVIVSYLMWILEKKLGSVTRSLFRGRDGSAVKSTLDPSSVPIIPLVPHKHL